MRLSSAVVRPYSSTLVHVALARVASWLRSTPPTAAASAEYIWAVLGPGTIIIHEHTRVGKGLHCNVLVTAHCPALNTGFVCPAHSRSRFLVQGGACKTECTTKAESGSNEDPLQATGSRSTQRLVVVGQGVKWG